MEMKSVKLNKTFKTASGDVLNKEQLVARLADSDLCIIYSDCSTNCNGDGSTTKLVPEDIINAIKDGIITEADLSSKELTQIKKIRKN